MILSYLHNSSTAFAHIPASALFEFIISIFIYPWIRAHACNGVVSYQTLVCLALTNKPLVLKHGHNLLTSEGPQSAWSLFLDCGCEHWHQPEAVNHKQSHPGGAFCVLRRPIFLFEQSSPFLFTPMERSPRLSRLSHFMSLEHSVLVLISLPNPAKPNTFQPVRAGPSSNTCTSATGPIATYDTEGCRFNMPASYTPNKFTSCLGDNQDAPGRNPAIPATSEYTTPLV
jgi:hypothetical protein